MEERGGSGGGNPGIELANKERKVKVAASRLKSKSRRKKRAPINLPRKARANNRTKGGFKGSTISSALGGRKAKKKSPTKRRKKKKILSKGSKFKPISAGFAKWTHGKREKKNHERMTLPPSPKKTKRGLERGGTGIHKSLRNRR